MARSKTRPVPFLGCTLAKSPLGACAAVFGAPHGTAYPGIDNRVHQSAPDAFRAALAEDSAWLSHWDYDFSGPLIPTGAKPSVDLGNLVTTSKGGAGNSKKIRTMTEAILTAGAVPLMFGGDDSVPIPFIEGFGVAEPVHILQIDAHIDWREERYGEPRGFSSTMRRASECRHVKSIVQAGARGMGSAREGELKDAAAWGAAIISCSHIHRHGHVDVVAKIPAGANVVICLDLDVLDSSVMPAVAYPSPGGLSFFQLTELIRDVAAKARIAGFNMVEFVPKRDLNGTAAFTAARIAAHVLAHVLRQNAKT
jgi:agmatinase